MITVLHWGVTLQMMTVLHGGGGYAQIITILHRGEGSLRIPKSDCVICARPLKGKPSSTNIAVFNIAQKAPAPPPFQQC